jgi:hypothetical protein
MVVIFVGSKTYEVIGVDSNAKFGISPSVFKGVRAWAVREAICYDFSNLIINGFKLIENKEIPDEFHVKEIKHDFLKGEEENDYDVQKFYLRETRKYWEARYTLEEMIWLSDFYLFIMEIECKVTDNWFNLYETIRGKLPDDFPPSCRFSIVFNNIYDRYCGKFIMNTVKKYLISHPDGEKKLANVQIPNDLVLIPDIGLTPEVYVSFVMKYGTHDKWYKSRGNDINCERK